LLAYEYSRVGFYEDQWPGRLGRERHAPDDISVIPGPVQCATDYIYDDILSNRRLVEIYTQTSDGRLTVDYGWFHDSEEA
jgi:hypothetical protein